MVKDNKKTNGEKVQKKQKPYVNWRNNKGNNNNGGKKNKSFKKNPATGYPQRTPGGKVSSQMDSHSKKEDKDKFNGHSALSWALHEDKLKRGFVEA